MKKYESMGFDIGQLNEIRQGLERGLDVEWYADIKYNWLQMAEIRKGLETNLNVSLYAYSDIPYDKMRQMRLANAAGLDVSACKEMEAGYIRQLRKARKGKVEIEPYIEQGYEPDQLEEIRIALEHGVNLTPYLEKEYLGVSLEEIRIGLEKGLKVNLYAKIEFGWQQMREIRLGLENRINVSIYAKPQYRWQQMREIRLGLEEGKDVSVYAKSMYSARDMREIRLDLEKAAKEETVKTEVLEQPKNESCNYSVAVSNDKMEVYLDFVGKARKTREEVMQILESNGIVYGIREDNIEDYVRGRTDSILAAEGRKPKRGSDGYYELFFRTEMSRLPIIREDGSIDYQNTQYFEQVSAGQVIAVYHEAKQGVSGKDVKGRELPAKPGNDKPPLIGKGFVLGEDQKTYIAEISGKINLRKNELTIEPLLITTDVTTSTGNLKFSGSIWVKGNVGSGVVISASQELLIEGNVEAANLKSGGNMVIKNGVSGGGIAEIEAGGELRGKFFEGATIQAGETIYANYVMNCNMKSGDQIEISGTKGSIIGGTAMAVNGIKAAQIGNRANVATNIFLGVNHAMKEEEQEVDANLKMLQSEVDMFDETYGNLLKKYSQETLEGMDLYRKIKQAVQSKRSQIEAQNTIKKELELRRKAANRASMVVSGTINMGTNVSISGIRWKAVNSLKDVTVRLANNEVIAIRN